MFKLSNIARISPEIILYVVIRCNIVCTYIALIDFIADHGQSKSINGDQ